MEEKEKIYKTPNDMKINITKSNGEVIMDEECCTMISIIMKNTGELGASFFGAHNPDVVKVLEKSLKTYFKGIKKELKKRFRLDEEEIKVVSEDIPKDNKWSEDKETKPVKVPATKVSPTEKPKNSKSTTKNTSKATTKSKSTSKSKRIVK